MKKLIKFGLGAMVAAVTFSAGANSFEDAAKRTAVWAKGHWDVPSNERLAYAVKPTTAAFPGETYFVEPDNEFDLAFGIEHALPMSENGTHFNLVLDYDQYSTSQNDVKSGATFAGVIPGAIAAAPDVSRQANINLRDHTWRLGIQRAKEFGRFDWRLGAFAEYSKVARTYDVLERSVAEGRQVFVKQESDGWGPSFDMMGRFYPWGRDTGFSVFGMGETAFLYTDQAYSVTATQNGAIFPVAANDANRADLNAVMTRIGASVGVGYARPISEDVMVGFRVGGRWMSYYNAFKHSSDLTSGRTDYDRVGPFLELRVGGTHSPM